MDRRGELPQGLQQRVVNARRYQLGTVRPIKCVGMCANKSMCDEVPGP